MVIIIIYAGTSQRNIDKITKLFYQGLRICDNSHLKVFFSSYSRSSAIIVLVFHSRPVLDDWATLCGGGGGSTQRPFSLVPLTECYYLCISH